MHINKDYRHFIHQTPLWVLPGKALGIDCAQVWLKLEHMQTGGSFKARGALYRLLSQPIPASGVVIASGGNAGIATAAGCPAAGRALRGVFARGLQSRPSALACAPGRHRHRSGAAYAEAYAACVERQKATGALLNHAYDQLEVVAGAGTVAAEIEAQQGRCPTACWSAWAVAGLIAGIAAYCHGKSESSHWSRAWRPLCMRRAKRASRWTWRERRGGRFTRCQAHWRYLLASARRSHPDALLLEDDAIRAAQLWLWRELKLAVEPAAALGLAALQTGVVQAARGRKGRFGAVRCKYRPC